MGLNALLENAEFPVSSGFNVIQRKTADVLEQAEALPFWSQQYTQLGKGLFTGAINSIHHNGIQIFTETMNRAVDQIASAPRDCYVIGLPTIVDGESIWGHLSIQKNSLLTLDKNAELYFRTSSTSGIIAAVIPANRLESFAKKIEDFELEETIQRLKPVELLPPDIAARLLRTLWYGLQSTLESTDINQSNAIWASFEEDLLSSCMNALIHANTNIHRHYYDYRIPRYIVNRVRDITLANSGFSMKIEELCEILRIRPRTLNQAFARALGVTPLTYIRNLKLQKVRLELISHPDEISSIANVASKWGFVHLSLFSRYYRELFGECPIETLHRTKVER
ncbi:MAG: helix-turn-helix domain-containing protein [Methylophilus sp.]|uniref:helix-turn-helix domain-containing protein n=1 Tax=Methylophilus sp. TaxID=29541 RepID=UPI003FA07C39